MFSTRFLLLSGTFLGICAALPAAAQTQPNDPPGQTGVPQHIAIPIQGDTTRCANGGAPLPSGTASCPGTTAPTSPLRLNFGSGEICVLIDNNTNNTYFVPTNTQSEWNAFVAAAPGLNIDIRSCGLTNGACGAANAVAVSAAPTTDLCTTGTASAVTGTGPWDWTCDGTGGGTSASCSAPLSSGCTDPNTVRFDYPWGAYTCCDPFLNDIVQQSMAYNPTMMTTPFQSAHINFYFECQCSDGCIGYMSVNPGYPGNCVSLGSACATTGGVPIGVPINPGR